MVEIMTRYIACLEKKRSRSKDWRASRGGAGGGVDAGDGAASKRPGAGRHRNNTTSVNDGEFASCVAVISPKK